MKNKVLVVATGRKTRGGITAVIKVYENTNVWDKWNCKWVETYRDSNNFIKIFYFLKGFFLYLFLVSQYRIIHFHISWPTTVLRKLPFFLLAKLLNKKIIIHLHSGAESVINGKYQSLYRFMFGNANIVIVLANVIKIQLEEKYNFNKIVVLNNPCPIFNNMRSIEKPNTILFAATLNENKGYSDLIRAFSLIAHKYPDWNVLFAGNGEIEIATKLTMELNISKQVEFVGWVSDIKKDAIFRKSSFFCLPSHNEGFPMAILDAWAYGLPVITTPVGGIPDVIVDGENGLIFNVGDIDSLSHKIEQLINNTNLSNKLSKASKKLSENDFSITEISKKLDEIYCALLD